MNNLSSDRALRFSALSDIRLIGISWQAVYPLLITTSIKYRKNVKVDIKRTLSHIINAGILVRVNIILIDGKLAELYFITIELSRCTKNWGLLIKHRTVTYDSTIQWHTTTDFIDLKTVLNGFNQSKNLNLV